MPGYILCTYIVLFVGSVVLSALIAIIYFCLLYYCHLAIKVFYPMKSAKIFNSEYSRTLYIAEVVIVILFATVPQIVFALVGSSYNMIEFPPLYCAYTPERRIYGYTIPVLVGNGASVIIMLLVIYRLHMVSLIVHIHVHN